jgi:hypothetical protein
MRMEIGEETRVNTGWCGNYEWDGKRQSEEGMSQQKEIRWPVLDKMDMHTKISAAV